MPGTLGRFPSPSIPSGTRYVQLKNVDRGTCRSRTYSLESQTTRSEFADEKVKAMEVLSLEVVFVISAFVALTFFWLGRRSAFKTIKLCADAASRTHIAPQLSSLNSAIIEDSPGGSESDGQKCLNSLRHREKYKKSKLSD